jgi:hypothetical protein
MSDEQRTFPRRPLSEAVYGYVDGSRFDGHSSNVSIGGMFLKTNRYRQIPMGADIAVVFCGANVMAPGVYLVGRVVRKQAAPVGGLGLSWIKALSRESPQAMARVLSRLIGVHASTIEQRVVRDARDDYFLYVFTKPQEARPDDEESVEVVRVEATEQPRPAPLPALAPTIQPEERATRGPITQEIQRDELRFPCRVVAELSSGDNDVRGVVDSLGLKSLTFVTQDEVAPPWDAMVLCLELPVGADEVPVVVRSRLVALGPVPRADRIRLELRVVDLNEDANPGILNSYVRWLRMEALKLG